MEPVEALISDIERLGDEHVREKTRALVRAVLELHRDGLARVLEIARDRGDGDLGAALAKDPISGALLALHDLLPDESLVPAASLVRKSHATCELCGVSVTERHEHLVDAERGGLSCACGACATLHPARRVRSRVERLRDFELTDESWESLGIPVGLAFFVRSTKKNGYVAMYPSPAGPTQSLLPVDVELPVLAPDVEALLVNRVRGARDCYRLSIDHAYELVGLLRAHWRGFTGGEAAWEAIARYLRDLEARC